MARPEQFSPGDPSAYSSNPQLEKGLLALEKISQKRARIAYAAVKHVIQNGGVTQDIGLYYTAMFGRSFNEGAHESDPNLILPLQIVRDLDDPAKKGMPIEIKARRLPDYNEGIVGLVSSFSEDTYVPTRFEISKDEQLTWEPGKFGNWHGHLAIAVDRVTRGTKKPHSYTIAPAKTDVVHVTSMYVNTNGIPRLETFPYDGQNDSGHHVPHLETEIWQSGNKIFLNAQHLKTPNTEMILWLAKKRGINPRYVDSLTPGF